MFGSVVDAPLMREGEAVLRTLSPLPLVCEQRDFSPWNLLIDRRQRLQVLDWESAELNGLPLVDLIYFTTYLGFYVTRSSTTESQWECYREMLQPGTFTGTVSSECQKRYAERLGIAASDILPLRLLCWMIHSRSEYQRMVVDSGGTPPPQLLRRSLFLGLWETELHSALRPGPGGAAGIKRQTPLGVEKGAVPDGLVT